MITLLPLVFVLSIVFLFSVLLSDKKSSLQNHTKGAGAFSKYIVIPTKKGRNKKSTSLHNQTEKSTAFLERKVIPGKMGKNRWLNPEDELGTLEAGLSDNTKRETYADTKKKLIEDFGYEFHQN